MISLGFNLAYLHRRSPNASGNTIFHLGPMHQPVPVTARMSILPALYMIHRFFVLRRTQANGPFPKVGRREEREIVYWRDPFDQATMRLRPPTRRISVNCFSKGLSPRRQPRVYTPKSRLARAGKALW